MGKAGAKVHVGRVGVLQLRPQTGETQQVDESMAVHLAHRLRPWREVVLLHLPADACLEGTLHRVACQVIGPFIVSTGQQIYRIAEAEIAEFLKIGTGDGIKRAQPSFSFRHQRGWLATGG